MSVGGDLAANIDGDGFGPFEERVTDQHTGHLGMICQRLGVESTDSPCADQPDSHAFILSGYADAGYPAR